MSRAVRGRWVAIARNRRGARWAGVASAVVAALVVGLVIGFVVNRSRAPSHPRASSSSTNPSTAGSSDTNRSAPSLSVAAVTPAPGSRNVASTAPISVTFSAALAPNSPDPSLAPALSGSWSSKGQVATFTPSAPYLPLSTVTISIPAGSAGVRGTGGQILTQSVVDKFRVETGSVLRLQQLLSLLDYSPLTWTPAAAPIANGDTAAQTAALYTPPIGRFAWRDRGWPGRLRALWTPGTYSVFTQGLIMSFQADHGLSPSGRIGPQLWADLLSSLASGTVNAGGYNFALADQIAPQSLTLWHDGRVVLSSPANMGIANSPTPDGTFPVYTRLRTQVMRGTNPGGGHYADLVQYIAYFYENDAVHYMPRADYGIPQSLGCVELPFAAAARAWPYLAYGTLVSVIG